MCGSGSIIPVFSRQVRILRNYTFKIKCLKYNSELLGFWTLRIIRYSKKKLEDAIAYFPVIPFRRSLVSRSLGQKSNPTPPEREAGMVTIQPPYSVYLLK
jgi:hypothetical protein